MVEDIDGSLWIEALSGLYHLRGFMSCEQMDESGGYPGGLPAAILIDRKGTVWVAAEAQSELRWRRPPPSAGPGSKASSAATLSSSWREVLAQWRAWYHLPGAPNWM